MEVTRKNFTSVLEDVSNHIKDATFLAIDGEFTGITLQGATSHLFETPEDRYKKLRETASKFMLIQFGIAAFQYCSESDRYSVRVYNFYVCPRPFARQAPDTRFLCQSSSIDFLASQGFDFNKLFREGIPFLRQADEEALRATLREKHAGIDARQSSQKSTLGLGQFSSPAFSSPCGDSLLPNKGPCTVPEEHRDFIDDVCTKIENFLNTDQKELSLDPCNGYLRKLIYQAIAQRFPSGVHLESKTSPQRQRYIEVSKATSEEEVKRKEEEKRRAEFAEVDEAVGFSKVIRMICESGKPVVGHNMLLDVLYIINQFCCPLPEDYEEFKDMTRSLLPTLIDTKHIASSQPFKSCITNTALAELHKTLQQTPFGIPDLEHPSDFPSYAGDQKERFHEAGYDAYITGLCFIAMANHLGKGKGDKETVLPTSVLTSSFLNKLFLLRMPDVQYMNLTGEDLCPPRDHVFHVTFPKNWRISDVSQLFAPFGNVQVSWIDDTSAFVALYRHEQADVVVRCLPPTEAYRVCTYHDHMVSRHRTNLANSVCETPKQASSGGDNKRKPSPMSDVDLPRKKRRSSRESPFTSNRNIPTIPEEEEAIGEENSSLQGNREAANGNHDLDVSITDSQRKGTKRAASEMFEVPDTW